MKVEISCENLDMLKWDATSDHVSQSSAVILYMLTYLSMVSAIDGVTWVPGEIDKITGRSSSSSNCIESLKVSVNYRDSWKRKAEFSQKD